MEVVMEIVSLVVGKVADCLFDAGSRQLGYFCNYNDNIEIPRKKAREPVDMKERVQEKFDVAKRNGGIIEADVQKWIAGVETISEETEKFLDDKVKANKRCLHGWCIDLRSRYRLSKKAQQKADDISQLHEKGKFDSVSRPAPPPGIISSSNRFSKAFESRKSILRLIMSIALNDDNVIIIGICGIGGVGKTTLVKEISKQVSELKLYDAVVMAVVSQSPNFKKIQEQIASMLGLTLPNSVESIRAGLLWERIKRVKWVVVILDDVWKRIELDTIGIPSENMTMRKGNLPKP